LKTKKDFLICCFLLAWGLICFFQSPSFSEWVIEGQAQYPKIDISGEKQWFYDQFQVNPQSNYYLYRTSSEASRTGDLAWAEKLSLLINADLASDLSVNYLIYQNPLVRGVFNVGLKYKEYSILLGETDFYNSNLFYSLYSYTVSGVLLSGKWDRLKFSLMPSGSMTTSYTTEALNNWNYFRSPDYYGEKSPGLYDDDPKLEYRSLDLKRIDVLPETVELYINEKKLIPNFDYFIFDDFVLFSSSYYQGSNSARVVFSLPNGNKEELNFDIKNDSRRQAFYVPGMPLLSYSEEILIDEVKIRRGIDYSVDYNRGLFVLRDPVPEDARVKVKYDYSYAREKHDTLGGAVEYNPVDWNTLKFSYSFLANKSSLSVFDPHNFSVYSLYERINFGQNAYLIGEFSNSINQGITPTVTGESGNAVKITGMGLFNNLKVYGSYLNSDSNFASDKRVKLGIKSKYNEGYAGAEYSLIKGLSLLAGTGFSVTQEGSATLESNSSFNHAGIRWDPAPNLSSRIDVRDSREKVVTLYQRIGIGGYLPAKVSDIILKYTNSATQEAVKTSLEYGWLNKFNFGGSVFLNYKDEINSQSVRTTTPLCRLGYEFTLFAQSTIGLFYDYSVAQNRGGGLSGDRAEQGISLTCKISTTGVNPILSLINLGGEWKKIDNKDTITPTNNFSATQLKFSGGLEF